MRNISTALTALVAATLALSACGGEADPRAKSEKEFQDAALKHAQCMRKNGVDFPDPKPGKGGVVMLQGPGTKNSNPQKVQAAEQKCKHFIEDVKPPAMSEKEKREGADRALAHARCMRREGIDFPDPKIDASGRIQQELRGSPGDEARIRRAEEKCQKAGGGGPLINGAGPASKTP